MVRFRFQISEEERLATRLVAAAMWFDGYEHSVDLGQGFGIIQLYDPAFLRGVVLVENSKGKRVAPIGSPPAPRLEYACVLHLWFLIQIIGIEDQRFSFGEEHTAIRLLGLSSAGNVVNFSDVEIPGSPLTREYRDPSPAIRLFVAAPDCDHSALWSARPR
jgi:hypothetical protein